jgi:hypothetical protein
LKKIGTAVVCILLLLPDVTLSGYKGDDPKKSSKINTNDFYTYIAVNQILMWISNNGDGSHDPRSDGNGFYWPGGINATKSAVFEDGLLYGGKINNEIRVNGNTHRQGLQAGKIINGIPDDPSPDKYRVYKIKKDWELLPKGPERDARKKDYEEWPIEDGAPYVDVDNDGKPTPGIDKPFFEGDEVLWYVANDMDTTRSKYTYGREPMGLEFQTTVFGFERFGPLADMVFKKYKVINKGNNTIKDMYLSYWSDTDLGDANDDYSGCDTLLKLGYTWNATNHDGIYGTPPPAMGYVMLQGPIIPAAINDSARFLGNIRTGFKNLPMTSFIFYLGGSSTYRDPSQGVPSGSNEFYNYMQGKVWNGEQFINPKTGLPEKFLLSGDPVTGTGWYEGAGWQSGPPPGDRRHLMSAGPFDMLPGDTQEVVFALIIAQGTDNLNSITELKRKSKLAQVVYDKDFQIVPPPPNSVVHYFPEDESVTLWWEANAETFSMEDPLIPDTIKFTITGTEIMIVVDDNTFDFEGYRIWQFKDKEGKDPVLLAVFDIKNNISEIHDYIYEYILINGGNINQEPILTSPDEGLKRFFKIDRDAYTGYPLFNESPYYFAVTSYAYSKYSEPPVIESTPQIIEVIPGRPAIDVSISHSFGDRIIFEQTSGTGDASVQLLVIDPSKLTGHDYRVEINGTFDNPVYNFIDLTANDTILKARTDFLISIWKDREFTIPEENIYGREIYDGFILLIHQTGLDSIEWVDKFIGGATNAVKGIYEINGPGGTALTEPVDVFRKQNSTGQWQIDISQLTPNKDPIQNLNFVENINHKNFEIRFTDSSQYYIFNSEAFFGNSPKAAGTVPFAVWDLGNNLFPEPKRLYIKIHDLNKDGVWSNNQETNAWEPVYVFRSDAPYFEEIPFPPFPSPIPTRLFGRMVIKGDVPEEGTVLRLEAWKPLSEGDVFEGKADAPITGDPAIAKNNLNNISVFPNPYFGTNTIEPDDSQRFVRFTNLPENIIIRIYSLGGVFVKRFEKSDNSKTIDWDLRNKDGHLIASGMYLAHLEIPGAGTHVLKLAVLINPR